MNYERKNLKFHYAPQKGWVNDPNGLVFFDGYYHVFYQHAPHFEIPFKHEPMHWGHARSKDLITWEELPVALCPDAPYDKDGCWSGTAIVKDDTLYLFYASINKEEGAERHIESVSIATSKDGIHFEKYEKNPIIPHFPADGGPDFRDPAVALIDGRFYLVMASGNPQKKTANLLLYRSDDLFSWDYLGVMCEWENCKFTECPSIFQQGDRILLSASVCPIDQRPYFSITYGGLEDGRFIPEQSAEVDKGPDQYAGQLFLDPKGRAIQFSWLPGWSYIGFKEKDVGCMSAPREFRYENGKITAMPPKELSHLLTDSDPALIPTEDGFTVPREGRKPLVYHGEIRDLKILRDEYILEVFVNGGEEIYSILL